MPLLPIYQAAILLSATLLFLVQPLFARLALPLFGGSPQVWATCMVFFQVALLAGYGYSHFLTRMLAFRRQAVVHGIVLLLPLLALPIAIDPSAVMPSDRHPEFRFLLILASSVGLPFLVVSTTGPLLQRWFSYTHHRDAADPYFLYAASNVGSMLGLLTYPLLIEPTLALGSQSMLWSISYGVLILLTWSAAAAGLQASPSTDDAAARSAANSTESPTRHHRFPIRRLLRWVALAFVPSSLMLALTTHVTTDIAVFPLLWVLPLAAYLMTFTLVFARRRLVPHRLMIRILPLLALVLAILLVTEISEPTWLVLLIHGGFFVVACLVFHGELAADRPGVGDLTAFYLMMAIGGALGGVFNALVSPALFNAVLEYPITLVLACLLCPPRGNDSTGFRPADLLFPAVIAGLVLGLPRLIDPLFDALGIGGLDLLRTAFVVLAPLIVCYTLVERPIRFGLGVGAWFFAATLLYQQNRGQVLFADRSFFGVHRVLLNETYEARLLRHGFTVHGMQKTDPALRRMGTAYYHPTGPAGQVFEAFGSRLGDVAIVGLGAGILATYAEAGQQMTYFEIDPLVIDIAEDEDLFTFLADARIRGAAIETRLGDARLTLGDTPSGRFDLLVLDAFSSDAIPVHLLTREALELYFSRLAPRGLLLVHVSNKRLNIRQPLSDLAADAGRVAWYQDNGVESAWEKATGKFPSQWVVLAREEAHLEPLRASGRWRTLPAAGEAVWTDDYSNILGLLLSH